MITETQVVEAVQKILEREAEISPGTVLSDLGLDSLSTLSVIFSLGESYSLDLSKLPEDLKAPVTVSDLYKMLAELE